jgi:hypothetical protein
MSTSRNSTPLYEAIRSLVLSARQSVARGVNLLQVYTNYEIGRRIFEQEQQGADRAQYGKEIVRELATRLISESRSGFSKSNLEYMRQFYLAYPGRTPQIAQTASGQLQDANGQSHPPFSLSWSHYVFLIGLNEEEERNFYEIEAAQQGWTLRELRRPFFIKQLEGSLMAHHRVGNQRRIYLCDVLEFAKKRDKERLVALDLLARDAFEAGLYERNVFPEGGSDE